MNKLKLLFLFPLLLTLTSCDIVEKIHSKPYLIWLVQLGEKIGPKGGETLHLDICHAVTTDIHGNVYCSGQTDGSLGEPNGGGDDAFVAKFDSTGKLLWLTQLGKNTKPAGGNTSGYDNCNAIVTDKNSNVYCAGQTDGDLGEPNGGKEDIFIAKFKSDGKLLWLTQLGKKTKPIEGSTADYDACNDLAIDKEGNIYCGGQTDGSLGEPNGGGDDLFIAKFSKQGKLLWLTQLGKKTKLANSSTYHNDRCNGIGIDLLGNIYCGGDTKGNLGEINGNNNKSRDIFVAKFNKKGKLIWITQLGKLTRPVNGDTSNEDHCHDIAVDEDGNSYCGGDTKGNLGEPNGSKENTMDILIAKFNNKGKLLWLSQMGQNTKPPHGDTSGVDHCHAITIDNKRNVYCGGHTSSSLGEINGSDNYDAFVAKFNPTGKLHWVAQFGKQTVDQIPGGDTSKHDAYHGLTTDGLGNLYCAGHTEGSLGDKNLGGATDVFLAKFEVPIEISHQDKQELGQEGKH